MMTLNYSSRSFTLGNEYYSLLLLNHDLDL